MFSTIIKTFVRQFKRNITFSLLNVIGLSLGIGVSYAILLYVTDELSYDKFHSDAENTYRVGLQGVIAGEPFDGIHTCSPMSAALVEEIPGIQSAIRIAQWDDIPVEIGDDKYLENDVILADSNFFKFFDFQLIVGNPETVLKGPNKIVLSEKWAKKYFGNKAYSEVLGQSILWGNDRESYEITGIVENSPKNSHFRYSFIISMTSWQHSRGLQWTSNSLMTYFKSEGGSDIRRIEANLNDLVVKYVGPEIEKFIGVAMEDWAEIGGAYGYFVQPMLDIHLHSHYDGEMSVNGSYQNVMIFSAIALFVLIIAGVNFINLSTARATDRAHETGIKKAVGAYRGQLIFQFLAESTLYVLISAVIAVLMISFGLKWLNMMMVKEFTLAEILNINYLLLYVGIAVVIGVIAGIYPSIILSSYKTVEILKGKALSKTKSDFNPRNVLVASQFALTTVAIITTLVVHNQLDLMRNYDLGFEKDQVLVINNSRALGDRSQSFKNEVQRLSNVGSVNFTSHYPPNISWSSVHRMNDTQEDHLLFNYWTDEDHLESLGITLLEGRFFEKGRKNETSAIINESAKKLAGWDSIEGKTVNDYGENIKTFEIIGVVKDFHFQDFKTEIQPTIIFYTSLDRYATIKISGTNIQEAINQIGGIWSEHTGGHPYNYTFVDQQLVKMLETEQRLADLTLLFSVLTIVTAGLGLFGLAAYVARSRRREFGIRKILGAGENSIIFLQGKYFVIISIISLIISLPVSYYLVDDWLSSFVYHIPNSFTLYLIAVILVVVIIIMSVGYQLIKSARMAPVEILRDE